MNEAAGGTRHLAFEKNGSSAVARQDRCPSLAPGFLSVGGWPNGERRMPNALLCAISCIVTPRDTSVTTLALVESGLIIVGKANCRLAKTAVNRGFAWIAHCSFQGGMCIQ